MRRTFSRELRCFFYRSVQNWLWWARLLFQTTHLQRWRLFNGQALLVAKRHGFGDAIDELGPQSSIVVSWDGYKLGCQGWAGLATPIVSTEPGHGSFDLMDNGRLSFARHGRCDWARRLFTRKIAQFFSITTVRGRRDKLWLFKVRDLPSFWATVVVRVQHGVLTVCEGKHGFFVQNIVRSSTLRRIVAISCTLRLFCFHAKVWCCGRDHNLRCWTRRWAKAR